MLRTLVLLSTVGMAAIVVISSIMLLSRVEKTKFDLQQCRIEVVMKSNKIAELEAERDFVKKDLGVFYPKIVIEKEKK